MVSRYMSLLNSRQDYVDFYHYDLDWQIIPLPWGSKIPEIRFSHYYDTPPTSTEIDTWFAPDKLFNLALLCGSVSNNVVCLDLDDPSLIDSLFPHFDELVEKTLVTETPSGRCHIYFRVLNGAPNNITLLKGGSEKGEYLSFRSNGLLATLPPSKHPAGGVYRILSDVAQLKDRSNGAINNALGIFETVHEFYQTFAKLFKHKAPHLYANYKDKLNQIYSPPKSTKEKPKRLGQIDQSLPAILAPTSGLRPCFQTLVEFIGLTGQHYAHKINFFLAVELYYNGFREKALQNVFAQATAYNKRKRRPNYDPKTTHTQYRHMLNDHTNEESGINAFPSKCTTLQTLNLCLGPTCPFFKPSTTTNNLQLLTLESIKTKMD